MDIQTLAAAVRNIPDFPEKGIQFKDITTLFQSGEYLSSLSDIMYERYKDKGVTKVAGIESRGFFMGPVPMLFLH
jgi:adenine phosphoribosyltransferase